MEDSGSSRKFLIATHGTFAGGIKSSLDIIIGAMDNVFLIQAYVEENKSIEAEINDVMAQVGDNDELVVFADILGGSVTNMLLQHALRPNVHIVSGFNLPLVIEILMGDAGDPIEDVITSAIENAKEQMVYVNKLITTQANDND
jgi:fructoselysine and glucoselysine-specific PTS system IIA component